MKNALTTILPDIMFEKSDLIKVCLSIVSDFEEQSSHIERSPNILIHVGISSDNQHVDKESMISALSRLFKDILIRKT